MATTFVLGKKDGKRVTIPLDQLGSGTGLILPDLNCNSNVQVGDFVYMDATATAQRGIATSAATSNIIGAVESKTSSTLCSIRVSGKTPANYSGLDVTKEYYLSDTAPGGIMTTPPTASGYIMVKIGQPLSVTQLVVNKGQPIKRI